jgi:hypothetical protein
MVFSFWLMMILHQCSIFRNGYIAGHLQCPGDFLLSEEVASALSDRCQDVICPLPGWARPALIAILVAWWAQRGVDAHFLFLVWTADMTSFSLLTEASPRVFNLAFNCSLRLCNGKPSRCLASHSTSQAGQ